ncbi:hypothetical protein J7T55_013743 [Diaporthe amygdali]|uniref:uncharacterized protein n=1 Tax=Phomopsis amygdali TaxID=1214568 RepID=UPI0022FDF777|nr:uncharacterized protein J7T55_013743 [Diaporthe amygdali]KAJ0119540.1 hypothetical protein J7T55_013743 [Diaporthe amygdali]
MLLYFAISSKQLYTLDAQLLNLPLTLGSPCIAHVLDGSEVSSQRNNMTASIVLRSNQMRNHGYGSLALISCHFN